MQISVDTPEKGDSISADQEESGSIAGSLIQCHWWERVDWITLPNDRGTLLGLIRTCSESSEMCCIDMHRYRSIKAYEAQLGEIVLDLHRI